MTTDPAHPTGTAGTYTDEQLQRVARYLAGSDLSPQTVRLGRQVHADHTTYVEDLGTFDPTELHELLRSAGGECAAVADLADIEHELVATSELLGPVVAIVDGGEVHPDWGRAALAEVRRARRGRRGDLAVWAEALAGVCEVLATACAAAADVLAGEPTAAEMHRTASQLFAARAEALRTGPLPDGGYLPSELR